MALDAGMADKAAKKYGLPQLVRAHLLAVEALRSAAGETQLDPFAFVAGLADPTLEKESPDAPR